MAGIVPWRNTSANKMIYPSEGFRPAGEGSCPALSRPAKERRCPSFEEDLPSPRVIDSIEASKLLLPAHLLSSFVLFCLKPLYHLLVMLSSLTLFPATKSLWPLI
jgi:hypothetical protein